MDGEPDPTSSGPGPGGGVPDDPNAVWRRPGGAEPVEPTTTVSESAVPPAPRGVVGRLTAWVRSWWNDLEFVQMWHVVAVAAILATAGFGGLDTVDKTTKSFTVGQPFDNNQFVIVVKNARIVPEVVGDGRVLAKAMPGRVYLGVTAQITNNATMPGSVSAMFSLPKVPDVWSADMIARDQPSSFRVHDQSPLFVLQPGLTENAVVIWNVPAAAVKQGSNVEVQVPFRKYAASGYVIYGASWRDTADHASVLVPVEAPK
ncbi:hypothetical protein [Mycobacteroides franklinii]|uniref:hypothetical protein n=1 Tax=Mycobacteroides franklinii TaxID=948102 RepID=UPI0013E8EF2C|nr:hypothetical protein [Mycobacteroides franklinii]